jgi:hypothetical protein
MNTDGIVIFFTTLMATLIFYGMIKAKERFWICWFSVLFTLMIISLFHLFNI